MSLFTNVEALFDVSETGGRRKQSGDSEIVTDEG
jgi:hypothetical protein